MPLRTPNALTDIVVATALKNVLLGYPSTNTNAGINGYPVYVEREGDLLKGQFPAILISVGTQDYQRSSRATWMGQAEFTVDYYDRWDQRPDEFDVIFANLALDLERMKANVEDNEALAQNNTMYAVSAYKHVLSPYQGILRDEGGMKLVYRRYTVGFHLLPYDG
jgi:hypothetical protein